MSSVLQEIVLYTIELLDKKQNTDFINDFKNLQIVRPRTDIIVYIHRNYNSDNCLYEYAWDIPMVIVPKQLSEDGWERYSNTPEEQIVKIKGGDIGLIPDLKAIGDTICLELLWRIELSEKL